MSRPRTSTAVLEAKGAFIKHPERRRERANEPVPSGPIGECPDPRLAKVWAELISIAAPGVLTSSDRFSMEMLCRLMIKLRRGRIHGGELAVLSGLLSAMGMKPSDRSKVHVPHKKEESKWTKLIAKGGVSVQ